MFLLVASVGLVLLHLYLWRRSVRDTIKPGRLRLTATVVLVLLALLMIAGLTQGTQIHPDIAQWFAWPGYLWLGRFFYLALLLLLLVLEIPRQALRRWVRRDEPAPAAAAGVSRWVVPARGSAALAGVVATGLVGYSSTVALGGPRSRTCQSRCAGSPPGSPDCASRWSVTCTAGPVRHDRGTVQGPHRLRAPDPDRSPLPPGPHLPVLPEATPARRRHRRRHLLQHAPGGGDRTFGFDASVAAFHAFLKPYTFTLDFMAMNTFIAPGKA